MAALFFENLQKFQITLKKRYWIFIDILYFIASYSFEERLYITPTLYFNSLSSSNSLRLVHSAGGELFWSERLSTEEIIILYNKIEELLKIGIFVEFEIQGMIFIFMNEYEKVTIDIFRYNCMSRLVTSSSSLRKNLESYIKFRSKLR